jgi:hypothetical protein
MGGLVVYPCPGHFTPGKEPPLPIEEEAEYVLGPVWMDMEKKHPCCQRSLNPRAVIHYQLHCPGPRKII